MARRQNKGANPFEVLSLLLGQLGGHSDRPGALGAPACSSIAPASPEDFAKKILSDLKAEFPMAFEAAMRASGGELRLIAECLAYGRLCEEHNIQTFLGRDWERSSVALARWALLRSAVLLKSKAPSADLRDYWTSQIWFAQTIRNGKRGQITLAFRRHLKQLLDRRDAALPKKRARDEWRRSKLRKSAFSKKHAERFGCAPETLRGWLKGVKRPRNE
jgi:hypothetical protein